VTKKKKLVEEAIKHPEVHTPAEIGFFKLWLEHRKARKAAKKTASTASHQD
jgi:hypothetical protein